MLDMSNAQSISLHLALKHLNGSKLLRKHKVSYPIVKLLYPEISGRKINSYERNLFQIPH